MGFSLKSSCLYIKSSQYKQKKKGSRGGRELYSSWEELEYKSVSYVIRQTDRGFLLYRYYRPANRKWYRAFMFLSQLSCYVQKRQPLNQLTKLQQPFRTTKDSTLPYFWYPLKWLKRPPTSSEQPNRNTRKRNTTKLSEKKKKKINS